MKTLGRALVASILATASIGALPPQQIFTTRVNGVRLDVSVLDGPTAVHGLTVRNFEVSDNGVHQQFELTETHDAPLDVVLVTQPEASLQPDRPSPIVRVAQTVGSLLRSDDRFAVIIASAGPDVVRPLSPTAGPKEIPALATATGGVALRDALIQAFLQFDELSRRKAILVVTDGQRDESWATEEAVISASLGQPAEVLVAAIDTVVPTAILTQIHTERPEPTTRTEVAGVGGRQMVAPPIWLVNLSRKTGGRFLQIGKPETIDRLSAAILDLRSQYVITFTPTGVSSGGWHAVNVHLSGHRGSVVTRAGYWAGAGSSARSW